MISTMIVYFGFNLHMEMFAIQYGYAMEVR